MLFDILNEPGQVLDSIRRYTLSLTASIVFGFRTLSSKDPRQAELYWIVENFTEVAQSAAGNLFEVFPILRRLPDILLPPRRLARQQHKRESKFYLGLWNQVKKDDEAGRAKSCLARDMIRAQEKEQLSDMLGAYNAGTVLEAGADVSLAYRCDEAISFFESALTMALIRPRPTPCTHGFRP